jgi:putative NADPH-quinone reductase
MRVLLVYCHPVSESFCAALRDAAMETLSARGHEVRLIDLYAEGFDPVMRADERRRYNDLAAGEHPLPEHAAQLRWAEALLFVYPTWWYGLPAMLKGWLDRVWTPETAFSISRDGGAIQPMMTHIRTLGVITTCGAPMWWSWLVGHPGRKTILRGIRALCAPRCRTFFLAHYLMDVSTPQSRGSYLEKVRRRLSRL